MKALCFNVLLLLLLLIIPGAIFRSLPDSYSYSDDGGVDEARLSSYSNPIRLNENMGSGGEEKYTNTTCEQMYGFLPCSETTPGHFFLILVYEYLLFHAESYVDSGGKRVFKILGPGVFGASAFQVIGSLPEALILLASGLLSDDEKAQECLLTGFGLLAGSSILLLTLIWGTCVILGSRNFSGYLNSNISKKRNYHNPLERLLLSQWPGYGVVIDFFTSQTSRIMLMSAVPLVMIQAPTIFGFSYAGERIFLLLTLVVSIMFLLCYFFYQLFEPSIQKRHLAYIKHEHLVVDVLKQVQNLTKGKLLTEKGSPNVSTIRSLFKEKDRDGDKVISASELRDFLQEIKSINLQSDKNNSATAEIMKEFDIDNDEKINEDEFINGMTKWLDDTKDAMNKRYHSVKSLKGMYQILEPWVQKKKEERETMKHLIPDILKNLQNAVYMSLLTEDGNPDVPAIKRLFTDMDLDKDDCISYLELKERITSIKFGIIPYDPDVAASEIMEELDLNRDERINEDEFVAGLSKCLNTTYNERANAEDSEDENNYHKTCEQMDKLLEDKSVDKSALAWTKAIAFIVLGLVMLGILAEPLIQSVRKFSTDANVPSFYVAFVFVPLATNARIAVTAINECRRKKQQITSLTMSEIYGTVIMNNVLGLAVLLSLVYFRNLAWTFSAEVLVVLMVSAIVGGFASFNTVYPVWTSILAYFLYPLSLVLVYILGHFDSSS